MLFFKPGPRSAGNSNFEVTEHLGHFDFQSMLKRDLES